MIAAHGLRWVLTTMLAVVTVVSLMRALRPDGLPATERAAHALHAVMGVAMAVMAWPAGMDVPATPQAVFFALAASWFAAVAVRRARGSRRGRPADAGHPGTHAVLHSVMMGGMAWMLLAMSDGMGSAPSGAEGSGSMHGMPGMAMSGPGGGMSVRLHGPSFGVAVVLLAVFVAMGLWWLSLPLGSARLTPALQELPSAAGPSAPVRRPQETAVLLRAADAGCHGAMALGMAVMLLAAL
ncbi:DUF5134 domain-containing protein [Actinacidiphila epipremni]|uniref:DUF5134 domain-containing protein n=1 Tax=Actinacidiphila epipremni TaxID=2053013 RepID=A0ABX0ZQW4_9ACTN|nr:DUF5134 domain-containing protein [Actinacidiphila epipremni]NJP46339.1 DUF5134 domain-containing protein [Actinacidiphila epipremni]